jgi:hypothetical protein
MQTIKIGGKEIHTFGESHSVEHATRYLTENPENARAFLEEAHHDHVNGIAHFKIPSVAGYNGAHDFTMIHNGDGSFTLRKKEHNLL